MQLNLIQLYTPTSFAGLTYPVKKTEKAPSAVASSGPKRAVYQCVERTEMRQNCNEFYKWYKNQQQQYFVYLFLVACTSVLMQTQPPKNLCLKMPVL